MANLTLSVEDDLLKKCRLYAVTHDTSVNAMVRDFLTAVANGTDDAARGERLRAVENLQRLARKVEDEKQIGGDWTWNRDDVYEDRLARRDER